MRCRNLVILLGNVGGNPEMRKTDEGKTITRLSLATSRKYTNKHGREVESVEWHKLTLFHPLSEIAEKYVRKGDPLYVEGRMHYDSYDDAEGVTRYTAEVYVDELTLLNRRERQDGDS